jgi:hypothetical protein
MDVQATVPASQVYLNDTDPLVTAPPVECDPSIDNPGPEALDYFDLDSFDQRDDVSDELQIPDMTNVAVEFQNDKGQRFDVIVSAHDPDVVEEYISSASLCLEAIPIEREPEPLEAVDLGAILIDSTGFSTADLSAKRDEQLANGLSGSLGEVISVLGGDPGAVLGDAITDAQAEINAISGMAPPDAVATDVATLLDQLESQPGAPFLVDPGLQAQDTSDWTRILQREGSGNVLVTFVSVVRDRGQFDLDIVYFAEDPSINRDQYRAYRAICSTWAGVQLYASKGSATVTFWRQTPSYRSIGNRYDAAGAPASSWLSSWSSTRSSWDAGVRGWQDGSYYSLYGGWTEGTGGFC